MPRAHFALAWACYCFECRFFGYDDFSYSLFLGLFIDGEYDYLLNGVDS